MEGKMITAGIDAGIENIKAVVLKDGKVMAAGAALSGGAYRANNVSQVWNEVLKSAGISQSDVSRVVATGQGKWDVKFASDHIVEPVADARVASFLHPAAKSVVDIGADQVRVVAFNTDGTISEVVLNQKCGAGIGTFLRTIARRLGMTLESMSQISGSPPSLSVNDACCVFTGLDAIDLLHGNTPGPDIVRAINEAIAARLNCALNDKVKLEKDTTVLIGGVARNTGVINALKQRSGIDFIIPAQPELGGALGAALVAAG
jgi:predicted CoA-substrate-specific enzyme activase